MRCPDCLYSLNALDAAQLTTGSSSKTYVECPGCGLRITVRAVRAGALRDQERTSPEDRRQGNGNGKARYVADDPRQGETALDAAWRMMSERRARLETIVRAACATTGRSDLAEDALGEVYARVPAMVNTFNPALGSLWGHLASSAYWYARKAAKKLSSPAMKGMGDRKVMSVSLDVERVTRLQDAALHVEDTAESDAETRELVNRVLDKLSEYDAWVLSAYYKRGLTINQMAALVTPKSVSYGTMYADYRTALLRAKKAADELK
jgi:hypothetical protein